MASRSVWERLREAQDELDDARAVRPTRCGSEEMQRDELAGDALPLLLAVVEAAAVYRSRQKAKRMPGELRRAQADLDEALAAVDPANFPARAAGEGDTRP